MCHVRRSAKSTAQLRTSVRREREATASTLTSTRTMYDEGHTLSRPVGSFQKASTSLIATTSATRCPSTVPSSSERDRVAPTVGARLLDPGRLTRSRRLDHLVPPAHEVGHPASATACSPDQTGRLGARRSHHRPVDEALGHPARIASIQRHSAHDAAPSPVATRPVGADDKIWAFPDSLLPIGRPTDDLGRSKGYLKRNALDHGVVRNGRTGRREQPMSVVQGQYDRRWLRETQCRRAASACRSAIRSRAVDAGETGHAMSRAGQDDVVERIDREMASAPRR